MSTRLEKPSMRFTVPDWHTANMTMVASGEQQRGKSRQCREEARQMQNVAEITSKWDQQENTTRLAQRVGDIEYWKNTLEKCLSDIDSEIASLSEAKHHTENALEAMAVPLDVALECLTLREGREGTDIVADGVEDQLNTEVQVIAQAKQQLQQRCREGFEKLIQLQEARQQVVLDLQDKSVAYIIDTQQHTLNESTPGISLKPDPVRVPKGSVVPPNWKNFSEQNCMRAESLMKASSKLREAIQITLNRTTIRLASQHSATDFAFRKRTHETERARDELAWQRGETEAEIERLERDVDRLDESMRDKRAPLKLAHTRLENRTARPNMELCRDNVQYGLTDFFRSDPRKSIGEMDENFVSVLSVEATITTLQRKLSDAKDVLHRLQSHLYSLTGDLGHKNAALQLDRQCVEIRKRLAPPARSATDANLLLTGLQAAAEGAGPRGTTHCNTRGTGIYDAMFNSAMGTMRETMGSAGGIGGVGGATMLRDAGTLSTLRPLPAAATVQSALPSGGDGSTLTGVVANKEERTVTFA